MDERMRFVIRLKDGESMASLCREFGISRKTGYKIFERYEQCGLEGLSDRARRPFRYANQLPEPVEAAIVAAKREKPNWGARKIRERLLRRLPHAVKVPACSTIHAMLDRHGLVTKATRSRTRTEGTPLSAGLSPNDLWCADYKGEFMLGDKRYCYPLTVTDLGSGGACRLLLQGQMHAFMAPVLLRMAGLNAFDANAQPQPPHRKLGEIEKSVGRSERNAVVGADRPRQTTLLEETLERGESELFPVGFHGLAQQQVTRSMVFLRHG
jgi:transposase